MEIVGVLKLAWELLKAVSLGVGVNELHRQMVRQLQRSDVTSFNLQRALHQSLLQAVDTLGRTLSDENHPYYQSITSPKKRREERQRIKGIFEIIQSRFPTTGTLQRPVELLLEGEVERSTREQLDNLGLEGDLAALPEALSNSFEANLPFVMLAHFRRRVATDESLCALLHLDVTTAGFQAVQQELHLISEFLLQCCGTDDPSKIRSWPKDLAAELEDFLAQEITEVKGGLAEVKGMVAGIDRKVDRLRETILVALPKGDYLRDTFYPPSSRAGWDGTSLLYLQLGGPGLERLCYLLLMYQGDVPRYFGNPGQKQYGIDLLVTRGDRTAVYQCKNEKSFPLSKMKAALQLFEKEWLGHPTLPTPDRFVLCCPLPLQERKQSEAWFALEREFQARTGVSVEFWDRNYLDERLRRLPDVVADLFSDRAAEQFCDLPDWNADKFRPLVPHFDRDIDRYLSRRDAGRLYLDPDLEQDFVEKLDRNGMILIRGLPGAGKTVTGLALAESLRHQNEPYRTFCINLRHDFDEDTLVEGINRRLTRPTIFFFDNCRGEYDLLDKVQARLRPILAERSGKGLLVFAARTIPTPEGALPGESHEFEEELAGSDAILELESTASQFGEIIALAKPHFVDLSPERLQKVFEFTGHNLFLLDELLGMLEIPGEIDQLTPEKLFAGTLKRYFKVRGVYRRLRRLAALAQFDLAPPVAYLELGLEEERSAASELLSTAGRPLRYYFLHSSAAELVFRALAWSEGIDEYAMEAASYVIEFFKSKPLSPDLLAKDLERVIHNHLVLEHDERAEGYLKSRLLADDEIFTVVEEVVDHLSLNTLAVCLTILHKTNRTALARYHQLVQKMVEDGSIFSRLVERPFWENGFFFKLIGNRYPFLLSRLREQLDDLGLCSLFERTDFQNALALLSNLSSPRDGTWAADLESVPESSVDQMFQSTLALGRSIGTISLPLRELKKSDPDLLEALEQKVGVERYLRLIVGAGTIFDLFMILKYSSLPMVGRIVEELDDEILDVLIDKTIASGRSIGSIHWALQELKKSDPDLLKALEQKMAARRYLRLIVGAGTIFELFMILQYSSLPMAGRIVEELDDEILDVLIDKTIASGRSIGTIHSALKELKKSDPDLDLLKALEQKMAARRYLRLIVGAGTIFELFRILQYSSLPMVGRIVEELDDEILDVLIDKTIASGRSIGTINLALRELKKSAPSLLAALERRVGAECYLRLIRGAGRSILDLFKILEHSSLLMAERMVEELDGETLDALIARTIASGRSIGTIDLALRELKKSGRNLLEALERKMRAGRWCRLVLSTGNVQILMGILQHLDVWASQELVENSADFSLEDWERLLLRSDFVDLCRFVKWKAYLFSKQFTGAFLDSLTPTFETLIYQENWGGLAMGADLLRDASDQLIREHLLELLHNHLSVVKLSSMTFDSFDEAIACSSVTVAQPAMRCFMRAQI